MARTPKNLSLGTLESNALETIYEAGTGINTTISTLSFTANTTTPLSINIYHSTASTDFLISTLTLPGGIGTERMYHGIQRRVVNSGGFIKIQADSTASFNHDLNGSEVEI